MVKTISCTRTNSVLNVTRYSIIVMIHLKWFVLLADLIDTLTAMEILKSHSDCSIFPRKNLDNKILKCDPRHCSQSDATLCRLFKAPFRREVKNVYCDKCLNDVQPGEWVTKTCRFDPYRGWSFVIDLNHFKKKKMKKDTIVVENDIGAHLVFSWSQHVENTEYYISISGTMLSIFSSLIFLSLLGVLPKLKNRGTLHVMTLIIFLLLENNYRMLVKIRIY